jgi:hypothetical protein
MQTAPGLHVLLPQAKGPPPASAAHAAWHIHFPREGSHTAVHWQLIGQVHEGGGPPHGVGGGHGGVGGHCHDPFTHTSFVRVPLQPGHTAGPRCPLTHVPPLVPLAPEVLPPDVPLVPDEPELPALPEDEENPDEPLEPELDPPELDDDSGATTVPPHAATSRVNVTTTRKARARRMSIV